MNITIEIADELLINACMTEDQANTIAAHVYQPLKGRLEGLEKAVLRLTACLAVELGAESAKSIINEINIDT